MYYKIVMENTQRFCLEQHPSVVSIFTIPGLSRTAALGHINRQRQLRSAQSPLVPPCVVYESERVHLSQATRGDFFLQRFACCEW